MLYIRPPFLACSWEISTLLWLLLHWLRPFNQSLVPCIAANPQLWPTKLNPWKHQQWATEPCIEVVSSQVYISDDRWMTKWVGVEAWCVLTCWRPNTHVSSTWKSICELFGAFFFLDRSLYIGSHIGTRGAVHEGDVLVGKGKGAKLDSLSLTQYSCTNHLQKIKI